MAKPPRGSDTWYSRDSSDREVEVLFAAQSRSLITDLYTLQSRTHYDTMTSRLKHKLELENVNLKSAYLNESFVQVSCRYATLSSLSRLEHHFPHLATTRRTSRSISQYGIRR